MELEVDAIDELVKLFTANVLSIPGHLLPILDVIPDVMVLHTDVFR